MKKIILILFSIISIFMLTGCYDKTEVNEAAYVIAIGIDKSSINPENISVTFEFALPIVIESEGGKGNTPSTYITIESPSLYSAINLVNSSISKEINLSHNKVIVFSEEIAINGISEYTSTIAHDRNFRYNMHILVSKCSAKEYLKNTNSEFEKNPAKFYETLFQSYGYTGFSDNTYLIEFITNLFSTTIQPVTMLGNISNANKNNSDTILNDSEVYKPNNADYLPGEIKKEGSNNSELIGLSVFRYSKLVGELTGEETIYYLITKNRLGETNYTIYDPLSTENVIDFHISQSKGTEIDVSIVDNVPLIKLKSYITADILSINLNIDYMNNNNISKIEDELEYILETDMKEYLYKTAKEFKSDISGFGNKAVDNYLTWDKWEEVNWLDIYEFSYFDVDIEVNIDKTGLVFIE